MKRLVILFTIACTLFQPHYLHAQLQLQSSFPITNGSVFAIDGRNDTLFIGGQFQYIGPKVEGLGFIDAVGDSLIPNYPQVSHSSSTAKVNVVLKDHQGGWYIGGYFTHVNGHARLNAAHILANGQVAAWNPSPEGEVKSMATGPGRVYLGGNFETIQGHSRARIASVDQQFGILQPYAVSLNQEPREMLLLGAHLYLSGWFSQAGGTTQNFLIRTDTASGAVDVQWNPSPNAYVYALATDSQSIFVGGDFTSIGGTGRQRLARLDLANGQAMPFHHPCDGQIQDLIYRDGLLLLSGSFGSIDNQWRYHIAGIDLNTDSLTALAPSVSYPTAYLGVNHLSLSGDTLFFSGIFSSVDGQGRIGTAAYSLSANQLLPWNPNATGPYYHSNVKAICKNGHLIALGGEFLMLKAHARYGLAAIDRKTMKVLDWNPGGGYLINTLELDQNRLWVGGYFNSFGGQNRQNLAIVDLNTGQLNSFAPAINGQVVSLHRDGDWMYLGGDFLQVDGQSRGRGAAYNWKTDQLLAWDPQANGRISALATTPSWVYVGGDFSQLNGNLLSRLARVDRTTGQDDAWTLSVDASVYDFLIDQTRLYVAGNFSSVGGQTRKGVFKLDAHSGQMINWVPATSIYGYSFGAQSLQMLDGYLYAGGSGFLAGRWNLMAIDTSVASNHPWSAYPCGWNNEWNEGTVNALFAQDGWLAVGGSFEKISGQIQPSLALYRMVSAPTTQITHAVYHFDSTAEVYLQLLDNGGAEILQWNLQAAADSLGLTGWNTLVTQQGSLPDSVVLSSLNPESVFFLRISATNSAGTASSGSFRIAVPKAPVPIELPLGGDLLGFAVEAEIGFAMTSAPQQWGSYAEAFDTVDVNGPFTDMGAVYVYKQWPGQWLEWQRLLAPDRDSSDLFGYALAKNGDLLAVGAPFEGIDNTGAVYLFQQNAWDQWIFTQKITGVDSVAEAHFGSAIDWWGNTLAVGSPGSATVSLFHISGNQLQHHQTLRDPLSASAFGYALKIYRDSLLIGAPESQEGGTASLWIKDNNGFFVNAASFSSPNAAGSLRFGYALALGGGHIVVSDPEAEQVYVFQYNASQWSPVQVLTQSPAVMGNHFGTALSWNGDQLLIGAPGTDSARGTVLPYHLLNGQWVAQNPIPAPDGETADLFGWSISQGAAVWIGAPQRTLADHRPLASNGGGAYAFNLPLNRGILAPTWNHGNSVERAFDPQWNPLLLEENGGHPFAPYPNPTADFVHIPVQDFIALELLDLHGRTLWRSMVNRGDTEMTLDLSAWPDGIYLLRGLQSDGSRVPALLFKY